MSYSTALLASSGSPRPHGEHIGRGFKVDSAISRLSPPTSSVNATLRTASSSRSEMPTLQHHSAIPRGELLRTRPKPRPGRRSAPARKSSGPRIHMCWLASRLRDPMRAGQAFGWVSAFSVNTTTRHAERLRQSNASGLTGGEYHGRVHRPIGLACDM